MKISLIVPEVNLRPASRPRAYPHCQKSILYRHGAVLKPIKDHKIQTEVQAHRYKKCVSCGRTFRHYPNGMTSKDQSQRTVVLAALMYGLWVSPPARRPLTSCSERSEQRKWAR